MGIFILISQLVGLREYVQMLVNRNQFLTAKLLKQGYRYHKIRIGFSKFYYIRHSGCDC